MTDRGNQLLRDALELPPAERAELAERMLNSLDSVSQREIDAAWAAEVEDRIDAYDRGEMPTIPAEEVYRNWRKRLGQ